MSDPEKTPIKYDYNGVIDHLLKFLYSEHDEDLLGVELHMLQDWLLFYPSSKCYTVSIVFFCQFGGEMLYLPISCKNICVRPDQIQYESY